MPDFEAEALETLLQLATLRCVRALTEDEADLLHFAEQWLRHNTDGMRIPLEPEAEHG